MISRIWHGYTTFENADTYEKLPSHIITSMYGLNDLSTYGAHPKDFDPEQLKPVLLQLKKE